MLSFPINLTTFKKSFLSGDGTIDISTDQDTWKTLYDSNAPFTKVNQNLVHLKLNLGTSGDFKFGESGQNGLKLSAGVSGQTVGDIRLIWPGTDDPLLKSHGVDSLLKPGGLYAAIVLSAKADASLKGTPGFAGPLKTSFGIGAGGSVEYDRLVLFNDQDSAHKILDNLFAETRLPQHVITTAEIPQPGEVLAFSYSGYLNLSASLEAGYSLSGTGDYKALNLDLVLDYSVRLMARASVSYRLAGEFSLEARKGKDPNWLRIVVRKSRESSLEAAVDVGADVDLNISGIPDTPDNLLAALLGIDTKSITQVLAKIEENTTIEGLEQTVGKLLKQFVFDRADNWIGQELNNETVKKFIGVAHQIVEKYNSVDETIIHLYEDFLDNKLPGFDAALNTVLNATSRDALQGIGDGKVWDLIHRLWSDKFYDLLLEDTEFNKFRAFVLKVKEFREDGAYQLVRELIAKIKSEFPLDGLLKEIGKFSTPADLKNLADEKLQAFVGRIVGKSFSFLSTNDDFKQALSQIQAVTNNIDKFRTKYSEAVEKVAKQKFSFSLSLVYKRAGKGEALLDVEIDLSKANGPALAEQAFQGNFVDLLRNFDPASVRINKGLFTHDVTKSTQFNVKIFNWTKKGIVELVQHSEDSIETVDGGLLHVYSIDTSNKQTSSQEWKKVKESTQSKFVLSLVAQTFQPTGHPEAAFDKDGKLLVDEIRTANARYEFLREDDKTEADELTQYLQLAQYLGLIRDPQQLVFSFGQQFPKGLGRVKVSYVVRYNDTAVRNAFTGFTSPQTLEVFARTTSRELVATHFTSLPPDKALSTLGFAYLSNDLYVAFAHDGFNPEKFKNDHHFELLLPTWFNNGATVQLHKDLLGVLATFFRVENDFVERLKKLSNLLSTSGPQKLQELNDATLHFVGLADDLDKEGGPNTFFAIFDRLSQEGVKTGGVRESAVIVEITPPPESASSPPQTITKYFHS